MSVATEDLRRELAEAEAEFRRTAGALLNVADDDSRSGTRAALLAGHLEAAEEIVATLNRLEVSDPDAIVRYGDLRGQAQNALDAREGGAALCRLTGRPRYPLTDSGNAERFAEDHAPTLRFVPGPGWHAWDGRRWARDEVGAAKRAAKTTARLVREEASALAGDEAEKVFKHAVRSEARARREAMVALAESEDGVVIRAGELDADPFLLNVANGTIDLRTGEHRDHARDDLITRLAPVEFDPRASAPRWASFLREVFLDDEDLIAFVQRAAGYSLAGDTREQCLLLLTGDGANGKTTLVETLQALLGDYAARADASTFMTSRAGGGAARPDVARLRGARFVAAAEVESDARLAEVFVKQVTGGDTMVARFLYRDEFEFRPAFKVWIAANHLPEIRGTDHAIWRRIRRIPFDVKIQRPDKSLPEKLRAELPGILNWAIEGCLAWQREGLGVPARVREATQGYRSSQDTVAGFIAECCVTGDNARVAPAALWDHYEAYCRESGVTRVTHGEFRASLQARGFSQSRSRDSRFWQGIGVAG